MSSDSQRYAAAYATARSCLTTLVRVSRESAAITFGDLLLALDDLQEGVPPATYPLVAGPADLLLWLESALRRMIAEGGDADALELILKFARAV
jgi:hypothetical protein